MSRQNNVNLFKCTVVYRNSPRYRPTLSKRDGLLLEKGEGGPKLVYKVDIGHDMSSHGMLNIQNKGLTINGLCKENVFIYINGETDTMIA